MKNNSWIIVDKQTGKGVYETWQFSITLKINTEKYQVFTALEYLQNLNRSLRQH